MIRALIIRNDRRSPERANVCLFVRCVCSVSLSLFVVVGGVVGGVVAVDFFARILEIIRSVN